MFLVRGRVFFVRDDNSGRTGVHINNGGAYYVCSIMFRVPGNGDAFFIRRIMFS